jgi:hypothetical protein
MIEYGSWKWLQLDEVVAGISFIHGKIRFKNNWFGSYQSEDIFSFLILGPIFLLSQRAT